MHWWGKFLGLLVPDAVQDSYLVQHVTNCTRHRQGQQSSLLDLVLSSDPNYIDEVSNLSALRNSDHDCLLWKYKCYDVPPPAKLRTPMFNYRKGDYQAMNDFFKEINWTHLLCNDRIEANWDVFKQLVNDTIVRFVPTSTPKTSKSPPWWTKAISDAIRAKMLLFVDTGGPGPALSMLITKLNVTKLNPNSEPHGYLMSNIF